MTKYEEFKLKKIKTVGELIQRLKEFPENTKLCIKDADLGGYDVCNKSYCTINLLEDTLVIGHMEYELYESLSKKEINREEYNELNEEVD